MEWLAKRANITVKADGRELKVWGRNTCAAKQEAADDDDDDTGLPGALSGSGQMWADGHAH